MTAKKNLQTAPFHWGMETSYDDLLPIPEFRYGVEGFQDDCAGALGGTEKTRSWRGENVHCASGPEWPGVVIGDLADKKCQTRRSALDEILRLTLPIARVWTPSRYIFLLTIEPSTVRPNLPRS